MIKRLFSLLSHDKNQNTVAARAIPRQDHNISRRHISPNALKVLQRLNTTGFAAYLVGGGVRDLLLGGSPKDFDVATNATPEQIKSLFRNSRIIGRRFRIAHVQFGREIIEVTTFRGNDEESNHRVESSTGQLLRDNVYGDMRSDALRRDFTANALYYSASDFKVYDYTDGIEDIKKRQLRIIGDPITRYREDPVRLLRAIRFAAKLGFAIEPQTAEPIRRHGELLTHVAPARLFDEVLKLFLNGYATATLSLLQDYNLLKPLFPDTASGLHTSSYYQVLLTEVMVNTDKRIRADKRVTPAFIYAALLWPALMNRTQEYRGKGLKEIEAFNEACHQTIQRQLQRIMIPKRFLIPMRQIWELQWRLPNRAGKRAWRLLEHPKFRAGYDFLLLREAAGEPLNQLGHWWTQFQNAEEEQRQTMVDELQAPRRRPRRRKSPKQNGQGDQ